MNQLSAYTWPDGTPRSKGNAFDIPVRPVPAKQELTKAQINARQAAYQLQYDRKKRAAKAAALRVNKEQASCSSNATNSERASR